MNHRLVANYNLGIDNLTIIFNETLWYLSAETTTSFGVYGSSSFQMIDVIGDWFGGELVRGGEIEVAGILIDDLGNRIEGDITASIGSQSLTTLFNNDTTFLSTGIVPEKYRNNHPMTLGYNGTEFIYGTSYKSGHEILVPSSIDFEFEPENVFPGDRVNVTLRLVEDDGKTKVLRVSLLRTHVKAYPQQMFQ